MARRVPRRTRSEQLLGIEDSSGEEFIAGSPDGDASAAPVSRDRDEVEPEAEAVAQHDRAAITTDAKVLTDPKSNTSNREDSDGPTCPVVKTSRRKSSGRYFEAPDVSIKCHRCGEVGHFSYDCVSDTPLVKLCSTCGEPGHSFIHCTNRICYNCGQVGHISNNCTSKRVRGLNRYLHDLLPKIRRHYGSFAAADLLGTRCMSCSEFGHVNCASEEADSKIDVFCPRCGSMGHTLAEHNGNSRTGDFSNRHLGTSSARSKSPPAYRGSRKKRKRLNQQQLPRRQKQSTQQPKQPPQKKKKKKKRKSGKNKMLPN